MSHYPQKQPPRFVPTLTQAVEHAGQEAGSEPPTTMPPIETVATPTASKAVGQPKKLLEEQLDERINALVAIHLRQLEVEIRAEIKNTLKEQRHRFFDRTDSE